MAPARSLKAPPSRRGEADQPSTRPQGRAGAQDGSRSGSAGAAVSDKEAPHGWVCRQRDGPFARLGDLGLATDSLQNMGLGHPVRLMDARRVERQGVEDRQGVVGIAVVGMRHGAAVRGHALGLDGTPRLGQTQRAVANASASASSAPAMSRLRATRMDRSRP